MIDITVGEYIKLDERGRFKYDALFGSLKKKEWLKIDLNDLTYNEVKNVFKKLSVSKSDEDIIFIFTTVYKITKEDLFSLPLHKFFQLKKNLTEYFVFLNKREYDLLQSVDADSGLWEMAGGKELNEFSDVLPLSQLAKIYGGYPFDYGEKKYIEIIYLLRMNNKLSKVEARYQELKRK